MVEPEIVEGQTMEEDKSLKRPLEDAGEIVEEHPSKKICTEDETELNEPVKQNGTAVNGNAQAEEKMDVDEGEKIEEDAVKETQEKAEEEKDKVETTENEEKTAEKVSFFLVLDFL